MAVATLSEVTRPWFRRLAIRPALLEPEDSQAILRGYTRRSRTGKEKNMRYVLQYAQIRSKEAL